MRVVEIIQDAATWVVLTLLGGIASGVGWLVRRVVTQGQEIDLLKRELVHMEIHRSQEMRDRETQHREFLNDLRALRSETSKIYSILSKGT